MNAVTVQWLWGDAPPTGQKVKIVNIAGPPRYEWLQNRLYGTRIRKHKTGTGRPLTPTSIALSARLYRWSQTFDVLCVLTPSTRLCRITDFSPV